MKAMTKFNPERTHEKVAEAVCGAYKKIENAVTGGYAKVEDAFVGGYAKVEGAFIDRFLKRRARAWRRPVRGSNAGNEAHNALSPRPEGRNDRARCFF